MDEDKKKYAVEVSVVIPICNEEENLYELRDDLFPVLKGLGKSFEVIMIDDGSVDRTPDILREMHEKDPCIRVIRFARNFGQQMATTAGLRYVRGRSVIIMDADLQTPSKHIPDLLAKLEEGNHIVYGIRTHSSGPLYRRIGTIFANFLIRKITGFNSPDGASGFLALNEELVQRVNRYNEKSRYLSGLFAWLSYGSYDCVPVSRPDRKRGKSHYGPIQLTRLVLNFITSFSVRPLHLATAAGSIIGAMSILTAMLWIYLAITNGIATAQTTLLAAVILFMAAIQLVCIGILGEYVGRTYGEVRQRPHYIIDEILEQEIPESK